MDKNDLVWDFLGPMIRLGIAQTNNSYDFEDNLKSICRAIEVHSKAAVDLVLFPECATVGYNLNLLQIDQTKITVAVKQVQELAKRFNILVALPTPWPSGDGKFYNSLLVINGRGKIVFQLNKVGFQKGEDKLFVPGDINQPRVFQHKGHRVGFLICIETTNDAWSFLRPRDDCDVILWPGFYATKPEQTWATSDSQDDTKVKTNIGAWGCPLIQVTCASSPEAQYWPDKVFGGSLILDRHAQDIFVAKHGTEDMVAIDLSGKEIIKTEYLLPN